MAVSFKGAHFPKEVILTGFVNLLPPFSLHDIIPPVVALIDLLNPRIGSRHDPFRSHRALQKSPLSRRDY
jgi:hypothetical protein